jgi:hypothetical protein
MSNTTMKNEEQQDTTSNNIPRQQSKSFIRSVLSSLLSNTSTWANRLRVLRQAEEQRLKLILERKKREQGGFTSTDNNTSTEDEVGKLSVGLVKDSISGTGASVDFSLLEDIMFQMVYEDEDDEALKQLIEIKFEDEEIPIWRSDADTHVMHLDSSVTRERPLVANVVNKELVPYILSNAQMKNIAMMALPPALLYFSKWKRLYSLERDGDSFMGSFLKKVEGQAKTLLIIETTKGYKFGGYAECAWESQGGGIGGVFYGTSQSCLFSFRNKEPTLQDGSDEELLVYKWTGANRYIQLIDVHARLIAFGGGGREAEFGLCIQDEFRKGSTGRCATFGNDPLCEDTQFDIMNLEFWGFSGACL